LALKVKLFLPLAAPAEGVQKILLWIERIAHAHPCTGTVKGLRCG
jgi:hypothetical protein